MLGPRLLLLLSCGGALLGAGLDDTSFAHPGPQGLKDSPQPAPGRGWCSTWGTGHFSTFDGHMYDFEGTCNYIFAAICKDASSPTFSVQLRRGPGGDISRVIVELGASVVTVQQGAISIKDVGAVSLPYTSNGLQITPFGQSVRLVAKQLELELVVVWGPGAHLMVLVEDRHMGRMCGLCGNFDGEKTNEFLSEDGTRLEPHKYAALQKLDDPNEICTHEAIPGPRVLQAEHARTCAQLLALVAPECNVPKEPFVQSCQADVAACARPGQQSCACATLSEYSRHCSLAGQPVSRWRRPGLCSLGQCPANQVYQECGEACVKTCSNPQHSCARFCTFGCFCPEGMVLDDVSKNLTCVPIAQCPCTLGGVAYAPGEVTADACRTCQCTMGRWKCEERPCPRRCALEGGSFVTTFDARPYRFHGTCTYTLLQSPQLPDGGSLMAAYDKSGYSHSETSLVALIYVSSQDKIVISQDEVVTNHGDTKWLPYKTGNITVFKQTSTHLQMATTFGLELVVQLQPVLQAYITVGPQFRGQTRGLCGNFNGDTTDDFTTSMGVPEGTASLFVDSWRAGNCPAALERETDPCSMSQLNKVCAETHCAVLVNKGTVFERCHAVVNPKPFYRRCVYQACNYEETFPHICAALGDYAHTCASRGILLWGWRSSVDNCTIPCTGNQTYSYDSRACGRTCFSLSDRAAECHPSAVPVEGCNCPEGTYLNHKAECVRKAQCPCLLDNHKLILAGQSTVVEGVICYCSNGRLSCPGRPSMLLASCSAPKTFQSCSQSSRNKFGAACAPTCQMLATGTPCVPTKCEPGCVCAEGLYENASGQCVPPEECPCEFAGVSYPRGAELHTDCKACTCSRGKWTCQQSAHCSSTCTLYGEGHVVTFDGQRFVFEGSCEYILATDGCGTNDSRPTFKILTENVVCGKSGVTCSRAIRMFLGGLSIVLADRNYTVSGTDPQVHFRVRAGSLHLVLDVTIGSSYNLTLIWNKHMTVSIKISRASQDALCGLCGNYNGNMKDDFETRSKYVASSELEFVNSWKESPLCGDARLALDPCSLNAFRRAWAERKCSIINSQTFAACHSQVYRLPYYEACVRDTCGCDTGGDCECLCDAVAAYAKACLDKGVCVDWRAPDFCPIYCDFYNSHTRAGDGQYQHTPETNCTWHYQPCLCPQQLQSLPDTNIEGCYNCSQDEYFDRDTGTCVQCMLLPTTPPPPTTGSPSTEARPTSATPNITATPRTTGPLSSTAPSPSPHATPATPTALAPASTQTGTAPTPRPEPTVSSGESPQTTSAITTRATSGPAPTATPRSTATGPTVTQATTQPTAPLLSTATQSTARSTVRTTATWPTPTKPETTTGSPQAPTGPPATAAPTPGHSTHHRTEGTTTRSPGSTTGQGTAHTSPGTRSTTATPNPPHTPFTSHSPHTGSLSTTSHITGTLPSPSTVPWTPTTRGTTQAPHSVSTAKTSTSLVSQPSAPAHSGTTSAPRTTISPKTTSRGTGSPGTHTATATPNGPHTPFTTHSPHTGSLSTTSHITGPPTGTSFRTTTTFPTASLSKTTQSTHVPNSATSSVTPTSHRVITPTQPETDSPSISTARPTGSSPSSTHVPATGTLPSPSTVPWTPTTRGTTQAPHSVSTAKTSTSLVSHPSAPAHSGTTSAPRTTISPKTTSRGTGSPGTHTATATPNGPHTPFTTHSPHTGSLSTTSHITGPPTGTSFRTTTTFPTASLSKTTQSTHVPNSATSSVTPTSHRVITPTQPETHSPSISTARPTGSSPSSTHVPATGTLPSPSTVPWTPTTRGTTQAPHSSDHPNTTRDPLSFHLYCKANRLLSIIDTRPCHRHTALTLHCAMDTYHKRNHPSPSLCQHSQNLHLPGVTPLRTCPLWDHICSTHHHLPHDHQSAHRNIIPDHHHLPNRISIQDHSIHSRSKLCHLLCHSHFSQSDHPNTTRDPLSFHLYCKANRLLSIIDTRPCHRHTALTLHCAMDTYHKRNHPSPSLCQHSQNLHLPGVTPLRTCPLWDHICSTHHHLPHDHQSAHRNIIPDHHHLPNRISIQDHSIHSRSKLCHLLCHSHFSQSDHPNTTRDHFYCKANRLFSIIDTLPCHRNTALTFHPVGDSQHKRNHQSPSLCQYSQNLHLPGVTPLRTCPLWDHICSTHHHPPQDHQSAHRNIIPDHHHLPNRISIQDHSIHSHSKLCHLLCHSHFSQSDHPNTTRDPLSFHLYCKANRLLSIIDTRPCHRHSALTLHSAVDTYHKRNHPSPSHCEHSQNLHLPGVTPLRTCPLWHHICSTHHHPPQDHQSAHRNIIPDHHHLPNRISIQDHSIHSRSKLCHLLCHSHFSQSDHPNTTRDPLSFHLYCKANRLLSIIDTRPCHRHTALTLHSAMDTYHKRNHPSPSLCQHSQNLHLPGVTPFRTCPLWHHICSTHHHLPQDHQSAHRNIIPDHHHLPNRISIQDHSIHSRSKLCHLLCHSHFSHSDHPNTTRDPLSFHLYCKANRLLSIIDTRPCHRHTALTLHCAMDTYHKRNHPSPSLCQHSQNLHLPGVTPLRTCPLWDHICSTHHHLPHDHQSAHRNIIPDHHHLPNRISIQDHSIHSRSKLCHLLCHSHFSQSDHPNTTRDHFYCKANRLFSIIDTLPCHRNTALTFHPVGDSQHKRNHQSPSLCQYSQNLHLPGVTPLRTCPLWDHICSTHHHPPQDHQSAHRNIIPDHHHLPNRISIQDHSIHSRSKLCHLLCHSHFSQSDHPNTTRDPLSFHLYCKANRLLSIIDTRPCHRHSALTLHSAVDTYHKRNHPSPSHCSLSTTSHITGPPTGTSFRTTTTFPTSDHPNTTRDPLSFHLYCKANRLLSIIDTCPCHRHSALTLHGAVDTYHKRNHPSPSLCQSAYRNIIPDHHHLPNRISIQDHSIHSRSKLCHLLCHSHFSQSDHPNTTRDPLSFHLYCKANRHLSIIDTRPCHRHTALTLHSAMDTYHKRNHPSPSHCQHSQNLHLPGVTPLRTCPLWDHTCSTHHHLPQDHHDHPNTTRDPLSFHLYCKANRLLSIIDTRPCHRHSALTLNSAMDTYYKRNHPSPSLCSEPSKPDTPTPAEVCRVRELEEEVTYQGCTANVTVTRCEGVCASSASFNAYTNQVDTLCSCCHPLGSYEKQLVLPCPDPGEPGKQLVLTLQVFKRCACGPWHCRDQGQPPW
ncbi:mucin-6 [Myotis daubentonii]|uniref:mucin-6 n=1 Tax=Myotis daubentonii TaxID=98922 RepID=UPI002872C2D8|nr:mucin-6 [Myotis daubentonii]